MYQSVSIHIDPADDIRAITDQPGWTGIRIAPATGGSASILFAPTDGPAAAIGIVDKFMAALGEVRDSLVVRHLTVAGEAVTAELDSRDPRYVPSPDEIVAQDDGA